MSPTDFQLAMLTKGFLPFCSGLCLKTKVMLNLKFNEKLNILLDVEFFHRVLYYTSALVLTDIISIYRKHESSTYHSADLKQIQADIKTWICELDNNSIKIPDEFKGEYRGFLLRRLSIFYSCLIYDHRMDLASQWLDVWREQVNKHTDVYKKFVTKTMQFFINVSLVDGNYYFFLTFLLARLHRLLITRFR